MFLMDVLVGEWCDGFVGIEYVVKYSIIGWRDIGECLVFVVIYFIIIDLFLVFFEF